MGYQLSLLESFADYLGVSFRIISSDDVSRQFYYLDKNVADIIALNLPVTREGKKRVHFSAPLGKTNLVFVQRKAAYVKKNGSPHIASVRDFPKDTVVVSQNEFLSRVTGRFSIDIGHVIIQVIKLPGILWLGHDPEGNAQIGCKRFKQGELVAHWRPIIK